MSNVPASKYAESEMEHFPQNWDEQTRQLVRFMIFEAYNSGHTTGYNLGEGTGRGIACQLLYDAIEKLQKVR